MHVLGAARPAAPGGLPVPDDESGRYSARRVPAWLLFVGVLLVTACCWALLQHMLPYLGHDEAVYATKGRSWLTGEPAAQWDPRRAPGLPALAYVALAVSPTVGAVRTVGLALLLATLVVVYLAASAWGVGRHRAVVAVMLVVSGVGFFRRIPEFLSDIPAAGLLVAVAALVIRTHERPRSRSLLGAPVLALAALYVRHGALAGLAAIGLAAVVVWGPRRWLRQGSRLVAAAGIFLAGLVPHLAYAWQVTGSPIGLLVAAGRSTTPAYVGDGLVYYVTELPREAAGPVGALVTGAGLVATLVAARRLIAVRRRAGWSEPGRLRDSEPYRLRDIERDRRTTFLGLAAVILVLLHGLTAHGEARFIFFSLILATVLGVDALTRWARRWRTVALGGLAACALLMLPLDMWLMNSTLTRITQERESLVAVAGHVSEPRGCVVVTSYQPEIGWYSGCRTMSFAQARDAGIPGGVVSSVLFQRGRDQPSLGEVRRLAGTRAVSVVQLTSAGALGPVRIVRYEDR